MERKSYKNSNGPLGRPAGAKKVSKTTSGQVVSGSYYRTGISSYGHNQNVYKIKPNLVLNKGMKVNYHQNNYHGTQEP